MDTARAFRKLLSIYVFSYFPFGFEGRIWDLIVSVPYHCVPFYFFVKDRLQRVTVDGIASEPANDKNGVLQGSVLGTVLFLIFINDLPASVRSSSRLFVDDCVIYREIRSTEDCQILQYDLQQLWEWERR